MAEVPVITVDGPSGTGKGSVSARLAGLLGWHVLDSGALYRVLALDALNRAVNLDDEAAVARLAADLDVCFHEDRRGGLSVVLGGTEVGDALRTEECGRAASKIAAYQPVRQALLKRQRDFLRAPGLIADGRDMGTVVFPAASLKIYLTASPEERVQRRYKQLKEQGFSVNLARLSTDIAERDARDEGREASPLKPAPDAVIIDTTRMDMTAVVKRVLELVVQAFPKLADQLPIN